jgi:integrase
MGRRRAKGKAGRTVGAVSMTTDVEGCPWFYLKPSIDHGKWRVRRRERTSGAVTQVVLSDATDLGSAMTDVNKRATDEAREAAQKSLPASQQPVNPITLDEGWKKWSTALVTINKIALTTQGTHNSDGRVILRALGPLTLSHEVTLETIEAFMATQATLAASTRLRYARVVRAFFSYLKLHKHVAENPMAEWRAPKNWRREAKESKKEAQRPLSVDEARALLKATSARYKARNRIQMRTPPEGLHVAVAISLLTGLRLRNVAGDAALTWADLHLVEGEETFTFARTDMKSKRKFKAPICRQLARLLRARWAALGPDRALTARVVGAVTSIRKAFGNALKRAKLDGEDISFHDLRRTFATTLANNDETERPLADERTIARLLDQADGNVTAGYTQSLDKTLRAAVNRLPDLLGTEAAKEAKTGS